MVSAGAPPGIAQHTCITDLHLEETRFAFTVASGPAIQMPSESQCHVSVTSLPFVAGSDVCNQWCPDASYTWTPSPARMGSMRNLPMFASPSNTPQLCCCMRGPSLQMNSCPLFFLASLLFTWKTQTTSSLRPRTVQLDSLWAVEDPGAPTKTHLTKMALDTPLLTSREGR